MGQHIQELEGVIDTLFNEVCPLAAGGQRGLKPLFIPALGALLPDQDRRELLSHRSYYRLDFGDFLDFATSPLPTAPPLSRFSDGEALFYQALNIDTPEPHIDLPAPLNALAVLDVAVARSAVFVSVTMRFRSLAPNTQPLTLVTLTFAPSESVNSERARLDEWDRCWIGPPVPGDPEWRFCQSGVYTDYLLDEMERHPAKPGALTPCLIERARSGRAATHGEYAGLFELARLALYLPAYFEFMYDLVVDERIPVEPAPASAPPPAVDPPSPTITSTPAGPVFRLVKSIRVIRAAPRPARSWTAPRYSFAVAGHWRHFSDSQRHGHDAVGQVVRSRTWVHDYRKFKDRVPLPGTAKSATEDPRVVIHIKQSLAYARDVLATASGAQGQSPTKAHSTQATEPAAGAPPSVEWMALERAKLTAQLRYLILRRDEFRCRVCGRSAASDPGVRLEVDHRVPVSEWGLTEESNLWTLCKECNRGKAARSLSVS